jgi:hypothetical protein
MAQLQFWRKPAQTGHSFSRLQVGSQIMARTVTILTERSERWRFLTEEAFDSEVHKTALKHENVTSIDLIVPLIQIKGTIYKVWGLCPW